MSMTSLTWPLQGATSPLSLAQTAALLGSITLGSNGDQLYQPMVTGSVVAHAGLFDPTQPNSSQRIYIPGPSMNKTHGSHEESINEQLGSGWRETQERDVDMPARGWVRDASC